MRNYLLISLTLLLELNIATGAWAQTGNEEVLIAAARRSPVVAAILELPRETPLDQLRAVFTLLDLEEPAVAAELWKNFPRETIEQSTQVELVSELGTAKFLSFARLPDEEFMGARDFVRACLKAAADSKRDPQRIQALITKLNDPSEEVRHSARVDLAATSTAGASACLEALAQAKEESLRKNLLLSLLDLRPEADPLLLAVLADGKGQVRRDVAELVGYARMLEAVPWLAAIVAGAESDPAVVTAAHEALRKMNLSLPSSSEARRLIQNEITRMEAGVSIHPGPEAENQPWWSFDPASGKIESQDSPAGLRKLLAAERLSHLFLHLPDATPQQQDLAKIYAYQVAKKLGKKPAEELQALLESTGTEGLSQALAQALERRSIAAAQMFVDLLGERADPAALVSVQGRPSPLAKALDHGDVNLRFAALQAVMKISPQQSFAGSSKVPKLLWYFAVGAGTPQAIAASSNADVAHDWAGQLRGLGYESTATFSGSEALALAAKTARLQMLFLDSDINRPVMREVIYQLRSYAPTSRLPIAVLCSLENLSRAESVAMEDDWLIALPRPHSEAALTHIMDELEQLSPDYDKTEKLEHAQMALTWIAELLESGHPYDEFLRDSSLIGQTLYVPELASQSLRVLASLGTAESQRLLLDLASTQVQPLENRRVAVKALKKSFDRYGKQLTQQEILQQYDRYNASETADAETQELLGQVLDLLEDK